MFPKSKLYKRFFAGILSFGIAAAHLTCPVLAETGKVKASAEDGFLKGSFVREFESPTGDAKPYIRWWVTPGLMNEEETRAEVRKMAEAGYGGIELVAIVTMAPFGSEKWNEAMGWALEEAIACGVKLDFTIGEGWPVKTPAVTDADDECSEQALFCQADTFTASSGNMSYECSSFPMPQGTYEKDEQTYDQFDVDRPYELVAVTAAKLVDGENGVYDTDSAVDLTGMVEGLDDKKADVSGASLSWEAATAGKWAIFYLYRQGMNDKGTKSPVVDHFSKTATEKVLSYWDDTLLGDPELKALYEKNGGSIFCDSLELGNRNKGKAAFWTKDMLTEFQKRRGYDLTPYLPALFIDNYYSYYAHKQETDAKPNYEFGEQGTQIREDFYKTLTELFTENHVSPIKTWANGHNMTLRYQIYGASMELTQPTLAVDIVETESWGDMDILDMYRMQSGAVHINGSGLYSTESAAVIGLAWAQSWTGSHRDGTGNGETYWADDGTNYVYREDGNEDAGFLYHFNRQMAAGVNRAVMHGFSYKSAMMQQWPGDSFMSMGGFPNEWDDKTPMWEHIKDMTGYLTRGQYVMQQGQADVDLAVYRLYYYNGHASMDWGLNAMEKAGYTYDYAAPDLLRRPDVSATVPEAGGAATLAADGPSYKALILDQRNLMNDQGGKIPSDMPTDVAEKILGYAKAGLPVIIVGDAPSKADTFAGSTTKWQQENEKLAGFMAELKKCPKTKTVSTQEEIPGKLQELGIEPDVKKDAPSPLLAFHRTEGTNDYYYLYNSDLNRSVTQTVELKGEGVPYLLDPWSGNVTKIGQYVRENGRIRLDISLAPNENCFLAVSGEGTEKEHVVSADAKADLVTYDAKGEITAKIFTPGVSELTLDNGKTIRIHGENIPENQKLADWTMNLEAWLPGDSALETKKQVMGPYKLEKLIPWNQIEGLEDAAGKAVYTTEFTLADGWQEGIGAYVEVDYVSDTMHVIVNGNTVSGINQLAGTVDIGRYLKKGKNTLTIEVVSNLANAKSAFTQEFGLVGEVTLKPYKQLDCREEAMLQVIEDMEKEADKKLQEAQAEADRAKADKEKAEAAVKKAEAEAAEAKKKADEKTQAAANAQNATEQLRQEVQAAKAMAEAAKKQLEAAREELKQAREAAKKAQDKLDKAAFQAKKCTLSKLKSDKKKQVKVTWKKVSGASGYQVQYATKSNFKGKKTLTIKGGSKKTAAVKKLSSGKKYYVRIRAYKKISGKNVYTKFSAKKSIRIK